MQPWVGLAIAVALLGLNQSLGGRLGTVNRPSEQQQWLIRQLTGIGRLLIPAAGAVLSLVMVALAGQEDQRWWSVWLVAAAVFGLDLALGLRLRRRLARPGPGRT